MPSCQQALLEHRNRGNDVAASRIHIILPQSIRAITCRGCVNESFYNSEESYYFLQLLGADDVIRSG